jgi:hypothetical protein
MSAQKKAPKLHTDLYRGCLDAVVRLLLLLCLNRLSAGTQCLVAILLLLARCIRRWMVVYCLAGCMPKDEKFYSG